MGRFKLIETPEKMWEYFLAYKKEVKENPRIRTIFGGKDFEERTEPLERPLTYEGFFNYCYEVVGCIDQYFMNIDNRYTDYITICSRIKKVIRQDQIEGGMVGQFNPSITQRLNGLADKTELEVKAEPRVFKLD